MPVECGGLSQHLDLTIEPTRRQRGRGIGIAQDVDESKVRSPRSPLGSMAIQPRAPASSTLP